MGFSIQVSQLTLPRSFQVHLKAIWLSVLELPAQELFRRPIFSENTYHLFSYNEISLTISVFQSIAHYTTILQGSQF